MGRSCLSARSGILGLKRLVTTALHKDGVGYKTIAKTLKVSCSTMTFSLRGVLTFVASGLDINGCMLSYFEGTAHLHCYTSCIFTIAKCNFFSVVT